MRHGNHNQHGNGGVGLGTAVALFGVIFLVLRMPKRNPAMFRRVCILTLVMFLPTWYAGDPPYTSFWWDVLMVIGAAWCSCAKEKYRT
jgi:hypothetical protein